DTTPPSVSIASPTGGTVSGSVVVSINASDNVGVTRVALLVNNVTVGTTNVAPYKVTWSATGYPNGTVTLKAMAYDAAGNTGTSATVSVTVQSGGSGTSDTQAPVVTITNPVNGSVISTSLSVKATA